MSKILNVPEIFGSDVFNDAAMQQHLTAETYNAWKHCIETATPLPLSVANEIAEAIECDVVSCVGTRFFLYKESQKKKRIEI